MLHAARGLASRPTAPDVVIAPSRTARTADFGSPIDYELACNIADVLPTTYPDHAVERDADAHVHADSGFNESTATSGNTICEARRASTWTVLSATCRRRARPSASPVL